MFVYKRELNESKHCFFGMFCWNCNQYFAKTWRSTFFTAAQNCLGGGCINYFIHATLKFVVRKYLIKPTVSRVLWTQMWHLHNNVYIHCYYRLLSAAGAHCAASYFKMCVLHSCHHFSMQLQSVAPESEGNLLRSAFLLFHCS